MVIWTPLTHAQPRLILWYSMLRLIKQNVLVLTFDKLLHKAIVSNYTSESENFNLFQGWVFTFFSPSTSLFLWQRSSSRHHEPSHLNVHDVSRLSRWTCKGIPTSTDDLTGGVQGQCSHSTESLRMTGLFLQCAFGTWRRGREHWNDQEALNWISQIQVTSLAWLQCLFCGKQVQSEREEAE